MRRLLVERNASFAGLTLVVSLARSKVSMAAFNEERAPPDPLRCLDLVSIVKEKDANDEAIQ